MKMYISGPMTGMENFNREAFEMAERTLRDLGHSVFNPAWLQYDDDTEFTYSDILSIDMTALSKCDAIYLLPGWGFSVGSCAEVEYAKALGLRMYCDENICDLFGERRLK